MPTHEFGERMHHDVRAMLERLAQIRCGQGIIDDQGNAGLLGNFGNGIEISNAPAGIGNRFDKDCLGLWW